MKLAMCFPQNLQPHHLVHIGETHSQFLVVIIFDGSSEAAPIAMAGWGDENNCLEQ